MRAYQSLLEITQNTRDLGGYVCNDGTVTRKLSLIRSDVQKHPSVNDIRFLIDNNVTTVIDMREESVVSKFKNGFDGITGLFYYSCPIEEGCGVPESAEAVPYSYLEIAESYGIAKVFKTICNAPGGVIFNCNAGKDRTGVVAAILLLLADVSVMDIVTDYLLTREYGKERLEAIHRNFPDVDMEIVTPNARHMEKFIELLQEKYGTVKNYLLSIGLNIEQIETIRNKLVSKKFPTHIVSTDGVVEYNGKILLVKNRIKGFYSVPGGQVENSENLIDALKREIKEETGIDVSVQKLFCISSNTSSHPGYNGYEVVPTLVNFSFICQYCSGDIQISDETSEVFWIDKDKASEFITGIPLSQRFKAYQEFDGNVRYLQYDTYPQREVRLEVLI